MTELLPDTIAAITGAGASITHPEHLVSYLLIDSRKLLNAETALFVAIEGANHDGHRYIPELIGKGVRNFVVSKGFSIRDMDANYYFVDNGIMALQQLAAYKREAFQNKIIGITGSNGKTIVKEWLNHILAPDLTVCRSPRSFNSQVGVPLSLWLLSEEQDIALIEAGISQPDEMDKLQAIIKPDIGILCNIGEAHAENFSSDKEKFEEKCKLFKASSTVIMPAEVVSQYNYTPPDGQKVLCWGYQDGDLKIESYNVFEGHTEINLVFQSKKQKIKIPFTDRAAVSNAAVCYLTMCSLGYSPQLIADRMIDLPSVAMRLELKEGINNCIVINDAYSSDVNALSVALDFLNQQGKAMGKTVILSDIQQSGRPASSLYDKVNKLLVEKNIRRAILIGSEVFRNSDVFTLSDVLFYETPEEFYRDFNKLKFRNESILLKGARKFGFERIGAMLSKKTHETVLEVNLDAVTHNLNLLRSMVPPETKIMAMVKAFSYGSGSEEIARLMSFNRVDYLAVAFVDEGITLRQNGVTMPVVVMNPQTRAYGMMIANSLEPELYNIQGLDAFATALQETMLTDKIPYPVHIKLDTGMHRSGFMEVQLEKLIDWFKQHSSIYIKSAFSHLAAADEPQHDDFTREQIGRFEAMTNRLAEELPYRFERHILNSAGIQRFPEAAYDMVRMGIGLYGIGATKDIQKKLMPASRLVTGIVQTKEVPKGRSIGYGRSCFVKDNTQIAIIPVGYADGFSRNLGMGRGAVWINGKRAPVLGSVCMDMTVVDITDLNAQEGDKVVIFDEEHPVTELAEAMGTIPYEVLTGISQRVKRVYYQES